MSRWVVARTGPPLAPGEQPSVDGFKRYKTQEAAERARRMLGPLMARDYRVIEVPERSLPA